MLLHPFYEISATALPAVLCMRSNGNSSIYYFYNNTVMQYIQCCGGSGLGSRLTLVFFTGLDRGSKFEV